MTALKIFILVGLISATSCEEGFFDKLKSGLQSMRNYLETVKEVADLVSDSLKKQPDRKKAMRARKRTLEIGAPGLEAWRLFFSASRLGLAENSRDNCQLCYFSCASDRVIFEVKSSRDESDDSEFDVLKSIVDSTDDKVQNLLKQAQSPELPRKITEQLDGMDLSCVKLLICKMTPFILKAQASLKSESNNGSRKTVFTSWLPSKEEFEDNSENCEQEHKDCRVFPEEFEQE